MSERPTTQGSMRSFVTGAIDGRLVGIAAVAIVAAAGYLIADLRALQLKVENHGTAIAALRAQSEARSQDDSRVALSIAALTKEVKQLREALIAKKVIRP